MSHSEHPYSSHIHVWWDILEVTALLTFISLVQLSSLFVQCPHPPKVKTVLFSFFQDHFLVYLLGIPLWDKYFFKFHIKNLSFKIITWNILFLPSPFYHAIIMLSPVVHILCQVAHRHVFQDPFHKNRFSCKKYATTTTNMPSKRKILNYMKNVKLKLARYDLDTCPE